MITKLAIENFRGLKNVTLDHLRRVTILVGGNDTGKTSVLEAITLLLGDGTALQSLPTAFRSSQQADEPKPAEQRAGHGSAARGLRQEPRDDFENFWLWLFNDRDRSHKIVLEAWTSGERTVRLNYADRSSIQETVLLRNLAGGKQEAHIVFRPDGLSIPGLSSPPGLRVSRLSVRPSNPVEDAERYNQVALNAGGEQRIEQVMRQINPEVRRLRYAKLPGTSSPLVFVDIGLSRAIPAPQMGQAFNRLLHIYTEILSARTNVLLVDEIENGVFTTNLLPIWKGLLAVCEQENVQVFATTHSLECVRAVLIAAKERDKDELSVQRMQVVSGQIEAVALSQETLAYALENNLEIRK